MNCKQAIDKEDIAIKLTKKEAVINLTKKDFEDALDQALNKGRQITDETHKTHHDYVQYLIERSEARKKLWMKFKLSLVGTIATSFVILLIWIGKTIWTHIPTPAP